MKLRIVFQQLGLVMLVMCFCMLLITAWAAWQLYAADKTEELYAIYGLLGTIGVGSFVGLIMWGWGRYAKKGGDGMLPAFDETLGRREALLLVALTWIVGAALSGLPYFLWWHFNDEHLVDAATRSGHEFASFASCYFEAMSGLTTTGSTVLSDISGVPQGLLLWRAMTHWLGGLGIVVLFVAVLPNLGVGGKRLFFVEAPGPQQQGVRPRIRETARILWLIYLFFTIIQVVLYKAFGLTWFEAVCHTFATLATGGFSTHNASIGYYNAEHIGVLNTWMIDFITVIFMILAGVNFGLYYHLARRRFKLIWKDPELRTYLAIIVGATMVVSAYLVGSTIQVTDGSTVEGTAPEAVRFGLFQVVSIQTTTGFGTANFNVWPFVPKMVLLMLMFVGASAGSTGGGIKVIRVLIGFRIMFAEIERIFRPSVVRPIRIAGSTISTELKQAVLVYILGIIVLWWLGSIVLMVLEPAGSLSYVSAATASAATLNNIGPGLEQVGAIENYGFFSSSSKMVMALLMALGRLEVYAILVLFTPSFWRSE
ncbi:Trk system potassium uptake protein TrkG [Poriferisphaera corsica]|uniref:Trk system potassium uptake protein TrkG n=1 Tax=Poriferisphaera corsica TaxID=2528020 RepID=A0A517YW39_9BACT|nr:TrkH family potassium uptake protein [Poriferisphaera corsica]QDU34426.1 Trk system potassium uptake protein TrkG [Poriferisphaera corsica]